MKESKFLSEWDGLDPLLLMLLLLNEMRNLSV